MFGSIEPARTFSATPVAMRSDEKIGHKQRL